MTSRQLRTRGPDYEPHAPVPAAVRARGRGRPTLYNEQILLIAEKLAAAGCTYPEIANGLGVVESAVWRWRNEHPEFKEALDRGRAVADDRVEQSLYRLAVGFTVESEKVFSNGGTIVRAPITEYHPPKEGAVAMWLKNRRKKEWGAAANIDMTLDAHIETESTPERELAMGVIALLKQVMVGDQRAASRLIEGGVDE